MTLVLRSEDQTTHTLLIKLQFSAISLKHAQLTLAHISTTTKSPVVGHQRSLISASNSDTPTPLPTQPARQSAASVEA